MNTVPYPEMYIQAKKEKNKEKRRFFNVSPYFDKRRRPDLNR